MLKRWIFALLTGFMIASCTGNMTESRYLGDTIPMLYARNITMVRFPDRVEVSMRNPWDTTKVLKTYSITKPYSKVAVFTSVHCALAEELGAKDAVAGVCDAEYIFLDYIQRGLKDGSISNLGNSMQPNTEAILELAPEAMLVSPYENRGGFVREEQSGITIIECADYMEVSPLARAEWIKFYGILLGKEEVADSIFRVVESRYLSLSAKSKRGRRPTLIAEKPMSGVWYTPCGGSTMGIMYRDAGAKYMFDDIQGTGSQVVSMEQMLDRGSGADLWLIKNDFPMTREDLVNENPILANIHAQVHVCDLSSSRFYEETPFHPDLLLENLISIIHPELGITPQRRYYK